MASRALSALWFAATLGVPLGRRAPQDAATLGRSPPWWEDLPRVDVSDLHAAELGAVFERFASSGEACPWRSADTAPDSRVLVVNVSVAEDGAFDFALSRCPAGAPGGCVPAPEETAWLRRKADAVRGSDIDGSLLCDMTARTRAALGPRPRAAAAASLLERPGGEAEAKAVEEEEEEDEEALVAEIVPRKAGAEKTVLDVDVELSSEGSDSDACAICLSRMDEPRQLPCGHHFCRECIAGWLDRSGDCPMCRHAVPTRAARLARRMTKQVALIGMSGLAMVTAAGVVVVAFPGDHVAIFAAAYLFLAGMMVCSATMVYACAP